VRPCGAAHDRARRRWCLVPPPIRCDDRPVQVEKLADIDFFAALSKRELQQLASWTDELVVPAGDDLVTEGRLAHEFFVIEQGTAEVRRNGAPIAVLGPGDFFGEMALLETQRRTASVVATSAMRLVVMFEREFRQMEREMPVVADRIRSAIRARLAD
jgi:CRP-like cAMP-binding protein